MEMAVIVQQMRFPFGKGHSADTSMSLLRPFRRLIEDGFPTGCINYTFLEVDGKYYVVGALYHTPGDQALFFPGLRNRTPAWQARGDQLLYTAQVSGTFLDHVTLEQDRAHWHPRYLDSHGKCVKFPPSSGYQQSFATVWQGTLIFWFSMAVKGPQVLEEVPETLQMEFAVPDRDADRRSNDLCVARKGARFHLLQHNTANSHRSGHFFFALVLDEQRSDHEPDLRFCLVNVPVRSPLVRRAVPEDISLAVRSHPVEVPGLQPLVWVVVASIQGELTQDAIFGAYT